MTKVELDKILEDHRLWLEGNGDSRANLSRANLSGADLEEANLYRADLVGANLEGADLSEANLVGADLRCFGNMKEIRTMQIDTYQIGFTKDYLQIGCKNFTIKEWENFTDEEIANMDKGALEWWTKWKDFIFKAIELSFGADNEPN